MRRLRSGGPRLLEHGTCSFTAQDVRAFLGRTLHGTFEGEGLTDLRAQERKGRLCRAIGAHTA